ncbi:MAG: hypothetical protein P8176_10490 [Gammaproteobacteria bacterium]
MTARTENSLCHIPMPRAIWVSYAGANQAFVQGITDRVNGPALQAKQGDRRVYMKTFRRDVQTSEQRERFPDETIEAYNASDHDGAVVRKEYFLETGDSIAELVQLIAINLRRLLVITPEYLDSPHCLWELCACLLARERRGEGKFEIGIITLGFKKGVDWWDLRENAFPEGHRCRQAQCLGEVLGQVYEERQSLMISDLNYDALSLDKAGMKDFFNHALAELSLILKLDSSQCAADAYAKDDAEMQRVAEDVIAYFGRVSIDEEISEYREFLSSECKKWEENLNNFFEDHAAVSGSCKRRYGEYKAVIADLPHTVNIVKIKRICNYLIEYCREYQNLKHQASKEGGGQFSVVLSDWVKVVQGFASLLVFFTIDPEWASELRRSSLKGRYARFSLLLREETDKDLIGQIITFIERAVVCAVTLQAPHYRWSDNRDKWSESARKTQGFASESELHPESPEPISLLSKTFEECCQDSSHHSESEREKRIEKFFDKIVVALLGDVDGELIRKHSDWPKRVYDALEDEIDVATGFLKKRYFSYGGWSQKGGAVRREYFEYLAKFCAALREGASSSAPGIHLPIARIIQRDEGGAVQFAGKSQSISDDEVYRKLLSQIAKLLSAVFPESKRDAVRT